MSMSFSCFDFPLLHAIAEAHVGHRCGEEYDRDSDPKNILHGLNLLGRFVVAQLKSERHPLASSGRRSSSKSYRVHFDELSLSPGRF
jgi:hypothetical protein